MFGYLTAAVNVLEDDRKERYKAFYCGLCRSLKDMLGGAARLTLNYDTAFLIILLSSLYEPEELAGKGSCLRHPAEPHPFIRSEISDYGACMNAALAYLKCLDDINDERRPSAYVLSAVLKSSYEKAKALYPRQCAAMEEALGQLSEIEKAGVPDPDAAADCFGRLMEELFIYRIDRWESVLRGFAHSLGRFIYLLDAMIDLEDDIASGSYNPFSDYIPDRRNEERFREILKAELGECVFLLDRLPLVQDADIIKNILCIGLWTQFNRKFSRKDP